MTIDPSIFKAYDIRGIYPRDINEENIQIIISAIYQFLKMDLKKDVLSVVLGRDMRVSSPSLFEKALYTLNLSGAQIINIGLVSTPTFYFAVFDGQYDAGIQISASHNPKEYNGIKFVKRVGNTLLKIGKNMGMDQVKELALSEKLPQQDKKGSVIQKQNVVVDEVNAALKSIDLQMNKPFRVVADPANAMGILYIKELFKYVPGDLIKMNFELDGTFPVHQPDPLQFETLKDLQKRVVEEKADFGIAPDGDGDRIFFIDEKGKVVPATLITSLITKEILSKKKGEKIIADIRYTQNVGNVCKKLGGVFLTSKVGHALITKYLNKENAAFAGESSGHYYFRETGGAESSVRVILYVLEAMREAGKPLSELLREFHSSFESGEYNFVLSEETSAEQILQMLKTTFFDGTANELDGLAVDYPDWRFSVRSSNTEPLLRLNLEAKTEELMRQKLHELLELLKNQGAQPK